jgi:hypothetical protein
MTEVSRETLIDVDVEDIFNFILKPGNLPAIWSNLIQVSKEKPLPNGGYKFNWKYKLAGVSLKGAAHHTDIAKNQWITVVTTGAVSCSITFAFRKEAQRTRVFFTFNSGIMVPVLGAYIQNFLMEVTKEEQAFLSKLKSEMEQKYNSPQSTI